METTLNGGAGPTDLNSRTAALMFAAVAGTCLGLVALVETPWVNDAIRDAAWRQAAWKKQIPLFCFYRHYLSSEDRLIHEDLPVSDFSHGGVYLVGASNVAWSLKSWDLDPYVRPWFHNFAMGGANQGDEFGVLRYLVEHRGLLEGGRSKSLVVFGVSYHSSSSNVLIPKREDPLMIRGYWQRHKFYAVDDDGTIRRTPRAPLYEKIILERVKLTGVVKELVNLVYTPFKAVRVLDAKASQDHWNSVMGDQWKRKIDFEVGGFGCSADYLLEGGAKVAVVRMPQCSWDHGTKYEEALVSGMKKACEERGIPIYDFSRLVPDDQFADSVHLTTDGMATFAAALVPIGVEHLESIGVLPPDRPAATNP